MAVKRGLVDENDKNPEFQQRNQRFRVTECLYKDELLQKFSAQLENLVRKVVQEETHQALLRHLQFTPRSLPNDAELREFKLHFEGQLPGRLFTGNNIEALGTPPLKVVLVDALSGHVVTDGPLSSAKIEIVALHGHFKLEDWTQKEFKDNLVPARDGKRPLLVGECVIALCNGVALINGICFTDNSSWERSKMFRLGAIMPKQDQVKEAVTIPFQVRDRRGETYQKHTMLSLEDEVWRLKGIAKDGKLCKRLANLEIYKVRDFLQTYHLDQSLLRNVLRVPPKMWETLVQQVAVCFSSNVHTNLSANTVSCSSGATRDQSMVLNRDTSSIDNNLSIEELLADDNQNWPPGYMPPSSSIGQFFGQDIYNVHTSNYQSFSESTTPDIPLA